MKEVKSPEDLEVGDVITFTQGISVSQNYFSHSQQQIVSQKVPVVFMVGVTYEIKVIDLPFVILSSIIKPYPSFTWDVRDGGVVARASKDFIDTSKKVYEKNAEVANPIVTMFGDSNDNKQMN
jgi:hypothetical protein